MQRTHGIIIVLGLLPLAAWGQVPPNGSFENGNFQDWNLIGADQADVLDAGDIDNQLAPTDGNFFALISTGPGAVSFNSFQIDGNGTTDYDITVLETQLQFNTYPAYLQFDWSFPTDEEDQLPQYDDVFRVDVDGQTVFGRSSCKPDGGISPFPAATCGPFPNGNNPDPFVDGNGETDGTRLRFGYPDWRRYCQPIPNAIDGANDLTLSFYVGDQADRNFDSALLLDNIRVVSSCEPAGDITVDQLTDADGTDVREKNGSIVATPPTFRDVITDADGEVIAFSAGMEFPTGTNTALHEQVFIRRSSGVIERVTAFTGNDIQHISLSADGRWLAVAARAVEGAALNIYLYDTDNLTSPPAQVTNTTGCDNRWPSVGNGNDRVVFVTECGGELAGGFNPDGNREVVVWNGSSYVTSAETSNCTHYEPRLQSAGDRRRAVFASDCNHDNDNPGGDLEYWRLQLNSGISSFDVSQLPQDNDNTPFGELIDISTDGSRVSYLVIDDADRQIVLIQNWSGFNRDRVGFGIAEPSFVADFAMERDDNPQDFAILRFVAAQGQFALSLAEIENDSEIEIAAGFSLKSPGYAPESSGNRRAFIIASDNLDADDTTNGYNQLFRVREN